MAQSLPASDALAEQHGAPLALALELHHQGRELVGRVELFRNDHELFRFLPL